MTLLRLLYSIGVSVHVDYWMAMYLYVFQRTANSYSLGHVSLRQEFYR